MRRAVVAAAPNRKLLSLEDWGELDEEEPGELVDGALEEEEVSSVLHELVVGYFIALLRAWAVKRGALVLGSEAKLAIRPRRGRKPDISMFAAAAKPGLYDTVIRVAPEVVIEVISPRPRDARRDRVDKLDDYAARRARYYWIVDPELRTVEIYELGKRGRYARVLGATGGVVRRVPGCPGLTVDLDGLWAEVEEHAQAPKKRPARSGPQRR